MFCLFKLIPSYSLYIKMFAVFVFLIAVAIQLACCDDCKQGTGDFKKEIGEQNKKWKQLYEDNKLTDLVTSLYTLDIKLLGPNRPMTTGRESALKLFNNLRSTQKLDKFEMNTIELERFGDYAYEIATFKFYNAEKSDPRKYIAIWKYVNNAWLKHAVSFNDDK